jgi:Sugar (and other) transporter
LLSKRKDALAKESLEKIYSDEDANSQLEKLQAARQEEQSQPVTYSDMLLPQSPQYHPTVVTLMGQINQALTGYGCISVYGPQIFELLGFDVFTAEHIVMANYLFYFLFAMTLAWLLIDRYGRRTLMLWCSGILIGSFVLLTVFGGLVMRGKYVPTGPPAILGVVMLFISTTAFGIGWLTPPWLIPTEIFPSTARAKGAAISVVIWGISNFVITFISPILFNNLKYWIFLAFAITNAFAGTWTAIYSPETGGRTFEENVEFFTHADEQNTWRVHKVDGGKFLDMATKTQEDDDEDNAERQPLLQN